jgi:hypothetical protein
MNKPRSLCLFACLSLTLAAVDPALRAAEEAATGEAATGEAATGEAATGEAATGEAATGEEASGEEATKLPKSTADIEENDADIMEIDVGGSISDAVNDEGFIRFNGDIRGGYNRFDADQRDGGSDQDNEISARFRLQGTWNPFETLRLTSRLAVRCSTDSCDLDPSLGSDVTGNTVERGKLTLDEFYLQWFRTERFNLAVGRLETKFVTRGGVFAKSLDRNNSNNTNVNWTDGLQGTINPGRGRGWVANLITEYNDDGGPSSVRRAPLDFSAGNSELSYFVALENNKAWGYIVQRGLDLSYLPDALLEDGTLTGRRGDYWGVVGRMAVRIPLARADRRLRLAAEIGYAPKTPTRRAVGIGRSNDDTSGFAWNLSSSVMDFIPTHSIGLLYGRTDAGWLLSPQYDKNEELIEIRWSWRPVERFMVDARVRRRKDLDPLVVAQRKRSEIDFFLRATWRFSIGD